MAEVAHLADWDDRVLLLDGDGSGPAAARNIGVEAARGAYIAFLDGDDLFLDTKLERHVSVLEAEPDASFSHTSYERMTAAGATIDVVHSGRFTGDVYPEILLNCPVATPTVLVRSAAIKSERFTESLRVADDTIMWITLARRSKVVGVDAPLTRVRMRESNAFLSADAQVIAWRTIAEVALPADRDLPWRERHSIAARLYAAVATQELARGRRFASSLAFARALAIWPFERQVYRTINSVTRAWVVPKRARLAELLRRRE
jgi:glycosyltransferase involved in cell wall biosynthesis